jgi:hypothetical protein
LNELSAGLAPKLFDDMLRKTKDFILKTNLVILIKTLKTHGNLRSWSHILEMSENKGYITQPTGFFNLFA